MASSNERLEASKNHAFSSQSFEGEDLVKELVESLMKDVDASLTRKSNEELVHNILSTIVKCSSTYAMINEIIDNLPIEELTKEQHSSVEETAEKLISLQEPQVSSLSLAQFQIIKALTYAGQ